MNHLIGYVSLAEAQAVEATATAAQVDIAEQLIDRYVGAQNKHMQSEFQGVATSGAVGYLIDTSGDSPLDDFEDDFYSYCVVEIIGGTNEGEIRRITAYDKSESKITVHSNFTAAPDTTSAYIIYQLSMFPRMKDAWYEDSTDKYYVRIPQAVKNAVLAQVEYIVEQGDSFFEGQTDITAESLGRWSVQYGSGKSGNLERLIAPKAKQYLRGIVNRRGVLISDARAL